MAAGNADLYQKCLLASEQSIRLLEIHPREDDDVDIDVDDGHGLSGTLRVFELDKAPKFTALSYTWGPALDAENTHVEPTLTHSIEVNGHEVPVRENLHACLLVLRKLKPSAYIWIDSVCIDQANVAEKASQVPMMSDIYSKAEEVVAWVGEAQDDMRGLLWLLKVFVPKVRRQFGQEYLLTALASTLTVSKLEKASIGNPAARCGAFVNLVTRRWFLRIWVAQETVLARRLRLLCGGHYIDFNDLTDLSLYFANCHTSIMIQLHSAMRAHKAGDHLTGGKWRLTRDVRDWLQSHPYPENRKLILSRMLADKDDPGEAASSLLIHLALEFRSWHCMDSHDRIYALLGVLKSVFPEWKNGPETFEVDYTITVETLYFRVAAWAIDNASTLFFLPGTATSVKHVQGSLPSWVPDFADGCRVSMMGFTRHWNAAGYCSMGKKFFRHGQRLVVSTLAVGTIEELDSNPIGERMAITGDGEITGLLAFCNAMPNKYRTGESRVEALWRTIILNEVHIGHDRQYPAPTQWSECFRAWLSINVGMKLTQKLVDYVGDLLGTAQSRTQGSISAAVVQRQSELYGEFADRYGLLDHLAGRHRGEIPPLRDIFLNSSLLVASILSKIMAQGSTRGIDHQIYQNSVHDAGDAFGRRLGTTTMGRRLFRSREGYIGLGTASVQVGDQIHVVHDCNTPMVLRPTGLSVDINGREMQTFAVIGEAYVHGLMMRAVHDETYCDSFTRIVLI